MTSQGLVRNILLLLLLLTIIISRPLDYAKPKLSEYGLFLEPIKNQIPNESILPYSISTQLFTDYAFKSRFIVLPDGKKIKYINGITVAVENALENIIESMVTVDSMIKEEIIL